MTTSVLRHNVTKRQSKMSLKRALKEVHDQTWSEIRALFQQYDGASEKSLDDTHIHLIDSILDCDDLMVAQEIKAKALRKIQMRMLALWGKHRVHKNTPESFDNRAKAAEYFAQLQESKGNPEAAEKQRVRAMTLREEAARLRAPPVAQTPFVAPVAEPILLLESEIVRPKPKKERAKKDTKEPKKGRRKK